MPVSNFENSYPYLLLDIRNVLWMTVRKVLRETLVQTADCRLHWWWLCAALALQSERADTVTRTQCRHGKTVRRWRFYIENKNYNTIAPSGSSGLAAKSASRAQHSIFVTTKLSSGLWTVECCALTAGQTVVINYQAQHNLQFCRLGVQWNCQTENLLNHHYYFPCGTLKWHTVRNCVWSAPPAPALRFQTVVMTTIFCKFLWCIMFRLPYNVQLAVSSQRTIISNQRFRRLDLE